ncbi:6170_t:CDS:2, partial [Gigaspora margarita]
MIENVARRELFKKTGLEVEYELEFVSLYKTQHYEVYVYKTLVCGIDKVKNREPDKHEEWFWMNRFYDYELTPTMSFFKGKILESIIPYYVVISGPSCVSKSLLIEKLSGYIISRVFNVKKTNKSILKRNEYLLKIKNQDLEKFEYGLLNHYHNQSRENSVYTLDETKRILSYYKNSFQNVYQDAMVINNNENIEIALVLMGKEISLFIKEEFDIYYKALRENPNDKSIVFWFQGMIVQEYKKYLEGIRYEKYDVVILDRSYNNAEIFSRSMITSDFDKTNYLSYLSKKMDSIKFKPDCVIYISVNNFDILKGRILKRGKDIEQYVDVEYFRLIFNMYEELI